MDPGWQTVEIDGRRFAVRRVPGPLGPELAVLRPGSDDLRLRPWSLADHLAALDRHAFHDGTGPRLDPDGLAREVLARACPQPLADHAADELAPLALWWAAGADDEPPPTPPLRPWSSLARARALDACCEPTTGALRVGSYLHAMVTASSGGAIDPHTLCGAAATAALDAVARVNAPADDLSHGPGSDELARTTLRLCRALGWTPAQVWSAAATEIDALLALLERVEAPPPLQPPPPRTPARPGGLASYPDAVIIQVGED